MEERARRSRKSIRFFYMQRPRYWRRSNIFILITSGLNYKSLRPCGCFQNDNYQIKLLDLAHTYKHLKNLRLLETYTELNRKLSIRSRPYWISPSSSNLWLDNNLKSTHLKSTTRKSVTLSFRSSKKPSINPQKTPFTYAQYFKSKKPKRRIEPPPIILHERNIITSSVSEWFYYLLQFMSRVRGLYASEPTYGPYILIYVICIPVLTVVRSIYVLCASTYVRMLVGYLLFCTYCCCC